MIVLYTKLKGKRVFIKKKLLYIYFFLCSCDKFYDKVSEFTGLDQSLIFELLLPINEAELYFFVRPENLDENLSRLIITSGSFNSASVNSLYVEMMNASERLENLSFLGRINSSDHQILKKIVDAVVRNLLQLLGKQEYLNNSKDEIQISSSDAENSFDSMQIGLIDLTTGLTEENQIEIDDEIFYNFNTSDIMEEDHALSDFYDPNIKGLTEGWDIRVNDKKYEKASFDEDFMLKFLRCLTNENNINPEPEWDRDEDLTTEEKVTKKLKRSKSDDDLQFVDDMSDYFGENTGKWKLRQRSNGRVVRSPLTRMSLGANKTTKKVKSNLFNDEEVVKWEKSKGSDDMSKLMSSTCKDYKNLNQCLDKDYKIPRKSYNGPNPRPPIHISTKDSKTKPNMIHYFQKRVDSLAPYESPSGYRLTERRTPASVSNFINTETIHVIDDDDEEDDNNNKDKVLQKGPAKRKLFNISPKKQPKIFKNRKTDYNFPGNLFSSSFSRNSSGRRQNL